MEAQRNVKNYVPTFCGKSALRSVRLKKVPLTTFASSQKALQTFSLKQTSQNSFYNSEICYGYD